jgi:hypothetical protein
VTPSKSRQTTATSFLLVARGIGVQSQPNLHGTSGTTPSMILRSMPYLPSPDPLRHSTPVVFLRLVYISRQTITVPAQLQIPTQLLEWCLELLMDSRRLKQINVEDVVSSTNSINFTLCLNYQLPKANDSWQKKHTMDFQL